MKQAIQQFHKLTESVHKNIKDGSLAASLQQHLFNLHMPDIDVQVYCRLMMSIYDLSNHHSFISMPSGHNSRMCIHSMSVKLKILSMRMVGNLVKLLGGQADNNRLQRQLQIQGLQIMILSIRICLDQQDDYTADIMQCWKYCQILYQYSIHSMSSSFPLTDDVHMLYVLDKMDILRLVVGQAFFSVADLQDCLQISSKLLASKSLSAEYVASAKMYIQNIVTQIVLKSLRNGHAEFKTVLEGYLPEKFNNMLNRVKNRQKYALAPGEGAGDVYELYCQITTDGMEAVSMDYLEKFITQDAVFQGQQLFQAILLLDEPCLLEIWYNEANKRTAKPRNFPLSYECFSSLVLSYLNKRKRCESDQKINQNKSTELVKLAKQVMLSLIRESKDTKVQASITCTYIMKLLISLVIELYNYETCAEMMQNLHLVSTKHSLTQIAKTNSILHLYYSLVNNRKNMDVYNKFIKLNSGSFGGNEKDKNKQTLKLLKTCAEAQLGITQITEDFMNMIKNKSEFALLFSEPKDKILLVLDLKTEDFICIQSIFELYAALIEENTWDEANLERISLHLENILLTTEFSKLKISKQSVLRLKNCIGRFIDRQNPIFCMLFLYLACFNLQFERIRSEQYGIVLNKFSKILKILDMVTLNSEIICILKMIICKAGQNFKKQAIKMKCSPLPGEIMFLKIINRKIEEWLNKDTSITGQEDRNSYQFVKYCLFEIFCLHNRQEELEQIIDEEQNPQLQQLYASSHFVPRKFKLILLRKLFKSNLLCQNSMITLNDFKQLIMLSEAPQECYIYVTSAIKIFGDKGKKFIGLLAQENEKVAQVCLQVLNDQ